MSILQTISLFSTILDFKYLGKTRSDILQGQALFRGVEQKRKKEKKRKKKKKKKKKEKKRK